MNIHEYQAKKILKESGIKIPNGIVILKPEEIENKIQQLKSKNFVGFCSLRFNNFVRIFCGLLDNIETTFFFGR